MNLDILEEDEGMVNKPTNQPLNQGFMINTNRNNAPVIWFHTI